MRRILVLLILSLGILILSGCGEKGNKAEQSNTGTSSVAGTKGSYAGQTLNIYNWSYYIDQSVVKAFEEKFGVKVVYDEYDSNEQLFAKLKAGATGYDIVVPSGDYVSIMIKEGMLEPVDKNKIPNMKNIKPLVFEKTTFDKGNVYSVPYFMGGTGVVVNKAALKKAGINSYPRDASIFEMAALKGKITLLDDMREVLGHALKHLGYSVNTTNPEELKKAKELVLKWKKNILKFDSESFSKLISQGEIWATQCYAENVFREVGDKRDDYDFFISPKGGPMYIDSLVILKDSKNKDLAYEFINFIHEPENYAKIVDFLGYPSINTEADKFITKKTNYELDELKNCELKDDLGEKIEDYNNIWQEIRVQN